MSGKGLFVTFEGGEGSGKSTQAGLLAGRLEAQGRRVISLREPGGTALGEQLRDTLLHRKAAISVQAELLLFLAARAELIETVIRPALQDGAAVICDRYTDSSIAYQGYGRGLDPASVRMLNRWATGGLEPDLTVLLDVPVDLGRHRKHGDDDAFYREDVGFHTRVREGYLFLAASEPTRWFVLDATKTPEEVAEEVWTRASALLE